MAHRPSRRAELGVLVLSGANSYTGGTYLNAGTLNLGIAQGTTTGPLGGGSGSLPTGTIYFNGGTLQYSAFNATDYSSRFATTAQTINIDTNGRAVTFGTALMGSTAGSLVLDDSNGTPGTLTLSAANAFTGGVTISAGTLKVGNAAALGDNTSTVTVVANAALDLNGTTMTNTNPLTLNGNGTGISGAGALTNSSGTTATYAGLVGLGSSGVSIGGTGNITLSNNGTISGTNANLTLEGAGGSIAGNITIGTGNLTVNTSGQWTLSGNNSFTGVTTASAGLLEANWRRALPGYNSAGKVIFGGGTIAALMGNGTTGWTTAQVNILLTNATNTSGALGIDTTNGDLAQWTPFTTTNFGSALGLTKLGANTLTLNQINTYVGATTVSAGTLEANLATALPGYTSAGKILFSGGTVAALMGNGTTGWTTAQVDTLLTNATKTSERTWDRHHQWRSCPMDAVHHDQLRQRAGTDQTRRQSTDSQPGQYVCGSDNRVRRHAGGEPRDSPAGLQLLRQNHLRRRHRRHIDGKRNHHRLVHRSGGYSSGQCHKDQRDTWHRHHQWRSCPMDAVHHDQLRQRAGPDQAWLQ